ncbi:ribonuclease T2 [Aliiroseovarius sp.]|uniref:ribonuclease T2 n=1 Tax=Aliiroseovarius sp. TaxID=1872442 RepID=UPI002604B233|nr:ribonuclease T2 [Aliiroseovarius sp.]
MRWLLVLLMSATLARAEGDRAGEFDYYVLALSWSPNWCAIEGDARGAEQCAGDRDFGWVLHGLWPQYERGWPSYCRSGFGAPSRARSGAMADIMGSGGSAWYQWKKHGTCSGLSPEDYYALARLAYEGVTRPPVLRKLTDPVRLPASVIEEAFLQSNPGLARDMITVTCRDGRIQEARLCLTRDLEPRRCGADVIRDCTMERALLDPVR